MTNRNNVPWPSRELLDEWITKAAIGYSNASPLHLVKQAGEWFYAAGADAELDSCCDWLAKYRKGSLADDLRYARRHERVKVTKVEAITALWQLDALEGLTDTQREARETLHRFLKETEAP